MKKKGIALFITLILAGALFTGCSPGNSGGGEAEAPAPAPEQESAQEAQDETGITVTDMMGREVRLSAPATCVVALTAADVEILFAIGAGDALVGRGEYCNYPPEALDIQSVESGYETNIEQVIDLEPQLLIMSKMAQNVDQTQQFEDAGIAVFVTDAQDIKGVYEAISLIGELMGKETAAEALVQEMKDVFASLQDKAKASDGEQKSIYFEVSPLEFGLWTAGSDTFMNEVAELLGLRNIFEDVSGWAEVSEEQVLERNPDLIMTVGMYFGDGPTPIEGILSRPGWENITAVKDNAIINLTADEFSRPGPRLALGAKLLYEFVFEGGSATPDGA